MDMQGVSMFWPENFSTVYMHVCIYLLRVTASQCAICSLDHKSRLRGLSSRFFYVFGAAVIASIHFILYFILEPHHTSELHP